VGGEGWTTIGRGCPKFISVGCVVNTGLFDGLMSVAGFSCKVDAEPRFIVGFGRIVGLGKNVGLGVDAKILTKGVTACRIFGCLVVCKATGLGAPVLKLIICESSFLSVAMLEISLF